MPPGVEAKQHECVIDITTVHSGLQDNDLSRRRILALHVHSALLAVDCQAVDSNVAEAFYGLLMTDHLLGG
ncbi:hypothetical protein VFPPC_16110 [Pochonia chlamydosporia 170]|uniref:Uncharacterized protein n=1 Tax=Pochonia chlamydosporia 170 TaxID=1380566 RepID=A0A179FP86_METCM|nr:hypothetical protein VFPPC_16110 [Pochonia chlamydosporia 170]OAQ67050.2 hypothetical protein VFPPC_16110 [Pochonia chlamydosporia 170]